VTIRAVTIRAVTIRAMTIRAVTIRGAWVAALVVVLLAPSMASAEGTGAPGFPCVGRWQGLGRNNGAPTQWTIDMVVTAPGADGSCGTIEYTNPTCGGRMLECRVVNGVVHVRERYTHDDGRCADASRLEFSCTGERMQWAWVGWETARSTLVRVDAPPSASPSPRPAPSETPPPRPVVIETDDDDEDGARIRFAGCGCSAAGTGTAPPWLVVIVLAARMRRRRPT
jgi:MYXO-CTERM domain-containing protein